MDYQEDVTHNDTFDLDKFVFRILFCFLALSYVVTFHPAVLVRIVPDYRGELYLDVLIVGALIIFLIPLYFFKGFRVESSNFKTFIPFALFVSWVWGSGFYRAENLNLFLTGVIQMTVALVVAVLFPKYLEKFNFLHGFIFTLILLSLGVSVLSIVEVILFPERLFVDPSVVMGGNRAFIGQFALLCMTISIAEFLVNRKIVFMISAFFNFVLIVISGSRVAILATLIVVSPLLVRKFNIKKALLILGTTVVLYYGLPAFLHANRGGDFEVSESTVVDQSSGYRILLWIGAWKIISHSLDNLIYGVGYTNFQFVIEDYWPFPGVAAHNLYLHLWSEVGLIGLILFCSWLVVLILSYLKFKSPQRGIMLSFIAAVMFMGLTQESILPREALCNFMALFLLVISIYLKKNSQDVPAIRY